MKPFATAALCLTLTVAISAQTTFTDPANLRGERVKPRDGRELPIDGAPTATGQPDTALALQQLLRRLNTRASILNIVAHPDDEDGGMLTLYSRGLGARVADLSLTRGEGGQNAMTGDFEDALGLLRTQELLANDRYTGVDQFFGTEVDFGFSKTKSEAFVKWTHDRVLYDAVRAIRLYRPLVITSTWTGNVTDGHGQHQAAGQIAQEAFLAAGDPKIFPELTAEGILPWQPLRIYARVPQQAITPQGLFDYATNQYVPAEFTNYVTGLTTTTPPSTDILVHEGTPDPLLTPAAANPADLKQLETGNWKLATGSPTPASGSKLTASGWTLAAGSSQLAAGRPNSTDAQAGTPLTYVQFARIGLGLQRSQIPANFRIPPAGTFDVPYHLYGSAPGVAAGFSPRDNPPQHIGASAPASIAADPNFFTGIDTSLESIATLDPSAPAYLRQGLTLLQAEINDLTSTFNPAGPAASAAPLAQCLQELNTLITRLEGAEDATPARANVLHELRVKSVQLDQALALALGLQWDATAGKSTVTVGEPVPVLARLRTGLSGTLHVTDVWLVNEAGTKGNDFASLGTVPRSDDDDTRNTLTAEHALTRTLTAKPAFTLQATRPYFFRPGIETPVYSLHNPELRNAPSTPPALTAWVKVEYRGLSINLGRLVHEGPQPLSLVPAVNLSLPSHAQLLPGPARSLTLNVDVNTQTASSKSSLHIKVPGNITVQPRSIPLHEGPAPFLLTLNTPEPATAEAVAEANGQAFTESFRPVGYGDLPRTNFYTPATTSIIPVDLTLPTHHHLAYLPGTGDAVPEALASIGLAPTLLTVADLTPANLAQYDTVILGVRTYAAHPGLHGAPTQALLTYAKSGGNVVVQYQTAEFTAADAPYPLTLGPSAEKVVDETDPVTLLAARSSQLAAGSQDEAAGTASGLLTTPNRITPADFDNWVEERGHGFLSTWDPRYTALTSVHDPGAPSEHILPQQPQRGGLITTQLGQGRWTYVAFALYRQLPEAVPGAFRLFVNLLQK